MKPARAAAKMTAPQPLNRSASVPRARDSSAPASMVRNTATNTMNRSAFRSCASRSRTGISELSDHAGHASVRRNSPPAVSGLVLWLTQSTKMGLPNTRTSRTATSVPTPVALRRRVLVTAMDARCPDVDVFKPLSPRPPHGDLQEPGFECQYLGDLRAGRVGGAGQRYDGVRVPGGEQRRGQPDGVCRMDVVVEQPVDEHERPAHIRCLVQQ